MRHIVLDTETTGLSFDKGHRIVEIGCVELYNYLPTGQTFHTYLDPKRSMDPGAIHVSGITDDFLIGKPEFHHVAQEFLNFIQEDLLIIHNAAFDMGFINGELKKAGYAPLPFTQALDTVRMAREKFPGSPANLDALCRRFEIDISKRTEHGALLDAQLLAEVYLQLVGGRQPTLVMDQKSSQNKNSQHIVHIYKEARLFTPSLEEREKHALFLEKIKNPIWNQYQA